MHKLILATAAAALMVPFGNAALSQAFPVKPVRIYTSDAGGGNDATTRLLALGMSPVLGQQIIVENRPAGVIPADRAPTS